MDRALEDGEQQLDILKAAPTSIHSALDSLEAELHRLCFTYSALARAADRLCEHRLGEDGLVQVMNELYESERQSYEICARELDERRRNRSPAEPVLRNDAASCQQPQQQSQSNTKKRQRTEPKQSARRSDKLKRPRHHSPASPHAPLTAFQLPPLAHFDFPATMIDSLANRCHTNDFSASSPALSYSSCAPSSTSSPSASDEDENEVDETDDDEPPSHPYNTPYLLPPLPSFSEHRRRSTLSTLLTFSHPLSSSIYSIHCLPIPSTAKSSWSLLARQAQALLRERNGDGGSSNGYYLLLVAAPSLLVSASYLVLTEASGRYTLAVNCFCTRTEMQGRGCGRVLYEAIRELRCLLSQWLPLTRPGSSGCQLVVHSVPATEAMWQSRFGLRRLEKGRDSGGGGYPNTEALIDLVDVRRDTEDRRREWLQRIVQWETVAVQNGACGAEHASTRAVREPYCNGHAQNGHVSAP